MRELFAEVTRRGWIRSRVTRHGPLEEQFELLGVRLVPHPVPLGLHPGRQRLGVSEIRVEGEELIGGHVGQESGAVGHEIFSVSVDHRRPACRGHQIRVDLVVEPRVGGVGLFREEAVLRVVLGLVEVALRGEAGGRCGTGGSARHRLVGGGVRDLRSQHRGEMVVVQREGGRHLLNQGSQQHVQVRLHNQGVGVVDGSLDLRDLRADLDELLADCVELRASGIEHRPEAELVDEKSLELILGKPCKRVLYRILHAAECQFLRRGLAHRVGNRRVLTRRRGHLPVRIPNLCRGWGTRRDDDRRRDSEEKDEDKELKALHSRPPICLIRFAPPMNLLRAAPDFQA